MIGTALVFYPAAPFMKSTTNRTTEQTIQQALSSSGSNITITSKKNRVNRCYCIFLNRIRIIDGT